jgi:hypothetical protein
MRWELTATKSDAEYPPATALGATMSPGVQRRMDREAIAI